MADKKDHNEGKLVRYKTVDDLMYGDGFDESKIERDEGGKFAPKGGGGGGEGKGIPAESKEVRERGEKVRGGFESAAAKKAGRKAESALKSGDTKKAKKQLKEAIGVAKGDAKERLQEAMSALDDGDEDKAQSILKELNDA